MIVTVWVIVSLWAGGLSRDSTIDFPDREVCIQQATRINAKNGYTGNDTRYCVPHVIVPRR